MVARMTLAVLLIAAPLLAADDFYEQQLRSGKADFLANRLPQAADEFRIAAFGLMQQPPLLQEALARLAVAQNALGQNDDQRKTIDRFVAVEQRFATYANVQLEPSVRTKFEELVTKQVTRATLQAIPSLAKLANYEALRIASLPASQKAAAYEDMARREPRNAEWTLALTRDAAARDNSGDVVRWGARTLDLDPSNQEVKLLVAHARASRRECKEALAMISDLDPSKNPDLYADQTVCFVEMSRWSDAKTALANVPDKLKSRADVVRASQQITAEQQRQAKIAQAAKPSGAPAPSPASTAPTSTKTVPQTSAAPTKPAAAPLDTIESARKLIKDAKYTEAVRVLRPAVSSNPDNRALKLALLEAAVLARDWRTAAAQVPTVTPLGTGEELYMFYASVALYETGRHDEAKLFMEKARPRMVPSPMVDYYVKTILGQS